MISHFVREVESGDIDGFLRRLQSFFADTPYELAQDLELHYENVLFIVFKLLGFYTRAEYHTSQGRVDLVVQTDRFIYVMEFKLDGTAEEALQQIEERGYARPFASDPRKLYKIGVNFSNAIRGIERWLVECSGRRKSAGMSALSLVLADLQSAGQGHGVVSNACHTPPSASQPVEALPRNGYARHSGNKFPLCPR